VDPSPIRRAVAVGDQGGLQHPNMITDVMFPAMMTSPLHTMADIREINSSITESMRQLYPSSQPSTPAPPGSTSRSSSSRAQPTSRPPPNAHEHSRQKSSHPSQSSQRSPKPDTSLHSPAPTSSCGSLSNVCSPSVNLTIRKDQLI
jgi:hypothetical protein